MAAIDFDANEVEPSSGFSPIPAGKYVAVITEDEMKDTRNGKGRYLQFTFEIVEGEYSGRKLWARLNLENENMEAVKIARADLSAICRAVNVLKLSDTVDLHNLPLVISVKLKKDKETDELRNEIKGYESKQAYTSNTRVAAPAAGAPATAPWMRK
jgi:hypothetical protein